MREFDRAAALGENREQTSSDRGSTPLAIIGIVAFLLEKRTHKMYVDRGPKTADDDDDWDLFS